MQNCILLSTAVMQNCIINTDAKVNKRPTAPGVQTRTAGPWCLPRRARSMLNRQRRTPVQPRAEVADTQKVIVTGDHDPKKVCMSRVERANLTIRMHMRRLIRSTNAFSKRWENLWAAYCLHFAWYKLRACSQDASRHASDGIGTTTRVRDLANLLAA